MTSRKPSLSECSARHPNFHLTNLYDYGRDYGTSAVLRAIKRPVSLGHFLPSCVTRSTSLPSRLTATRSISPARVHQSRMRPIKRSKPKQMVCTRGPIATTDATESSSIARRGRHWALGQYVRSFPDHLTYPKVTWKGKGV